MSELKPIRIGDRVTKFPALTHNALIAGEQKRRNELEQIDDLRKPKQKLPCVVRIAWSGASDLPPGSAVKLGNVLFEPGTDVWAPYEGLAFYADEFSTGQTGEPYAVTLDQIAAKAGSTYQIGSAVIPQAYWCKVDVSDAGHGYAKRPDTGTVMVSSVAGDKVLWKEAGTGEKWAVVEVRGGDRLRALRGTWQSGTTTLVIDNIYLLDSGLDPRAVPGDLAETLDVTNVAGDTYSSGDKVYADYNDDLDRWEARPKGSAGTTPPPLRRFELTATKLRTDATATAKFLDDAGNMTGSNETLYDPELIFSGRAANYVGTIDGFRGVALKRTDLGGLEVDRWEIVQMEGYAEWVVLTYAGSPTNAWQLTSFGGTQWNYKRPAADSGSITVSDPLSVLGSPANGDMVICRLSNPDTSPPTYQERERKRSGDTDLTLKTVTGVDISVTGNDLKVQINYAQYSIRGIDLSSTGNYSDQIAIKDVLKALDAYASGSDQSIGHDGGSDPEWQDDGAC